MLWRDCTDAMAHLRNRCSQMPLILKSFLACCGPTSSKFVAYLRFASGDLSLQHRFNTKHLVVIILRSLIQISVSVNGY